MKKAFERSYAASGLFLIVLSLINLFTGVGHLNSVYVLMCVGLFIFFDSLNYFFINQDALLSGKISLLSGSLFVIFSGAVITFFVEVYGSALTGVLPGMIPMSLIEQGLSVKLLNQSLETILLYGILVLPGYSIYRILDKVFQSEVMLNEEFGCKDYYRYFVHLGLLMLAMPFTLIFVDLSLNMEYLMFLGSVIGLLFVIEYFEFRKKGQGMIADVIYRNFDKFGAVMGGSILTGFIATVITYNTGFWVSQEIPFTGLRLFDAPVSMVLVWTMIIWVMASGFNLISDTDLSKFNPIK